MMAILTILGRLTCVISGFFWYPLYYVLSTFCLLWCGSGVLMIWLLMIQQWWCENFVVSIFQLAVVEIKKPRDPSGEIFHRTISWDILEPRTTPKTQIVLGYVLGQGISYVPRMIHIWLVFTKNDAYITVCFYTYFLFRIGRLSHHVQGKTGSLRNLSNWWK